MDRLHVSEDGIEVFDFKTDVVGSSAELLSRYRGQMEAYQKAVAKVFGVEAGSVSCKLVSTHLGALVEIGEPPLQGELGL